MATYTARSRQTGTVVTVTLAEAEGVEDGGAGRWVTICEDHGFLINSATRNLALATKPLDFCDMCRRTAGQDFGEYYNSTLDRRDQAPATAISPYGQREIDPHELQAGDSFHQFSPTGGEWQVLSADESGIRVKSDRGATRTMDWSYIASKGTVFAKRVTR